MRFTATVELGGRTATGIEVPRTTLEALGAGRKPPVRVTIGGHTYRDEVDVDLEVDDAPRTVSVPSDLGAALDADGDARAAFDALAYSHQLRHVLAVDGAKTPQTRQRRIDKAVEALRAATAGGAPSAR